MIFKSGVERSLEGMTAMVKKPNPTYLRRIDEPFEVETEHGVMRGERGDFLAYDPLSKHSWPVSADYVALHYEPARVGSGSSA